MRRTFIDIVVGGLALLALAGCGAAPSSAAIVGGWKFEQSGTVAPDGTFTPSQFDSSCSCSPETNMELHFAADGSVTRIGTGPSQHGSYAFTDAGHMTLALAAMPGEAADAQAFEVIIADGRLILRTVDAGRTLDQRFVRVE